MLKRLDPLPRFVLGMAGLLVLLALTAGLWWWLPAWPQATLTSQRGPSNLIHVSPNGQTLVTIHENCLATWEVPARRERGMTTFKGHLRVRFSPDGQTLAIGEQSELGAPLFDSVRLWQPTAGSAPVPLSHSHKIIDFTGDSRLFLTWTPQEHKAWDTTTHEDRPFPMRFRQSAAVHPLRDGRIVVSEYLVHDGWLLDEVSTRLWTFDGDLKPASGLIELRGISTPITISPDGRLITAWLDGEPNVLKLYDLNTGGEMGSFPTTFVGWQFPTPLFSPDGRRLITDDQTVWDITTAPPRKVGTVEGTVRFSPDGKWIARLPRLYPSIECWDFFDAATLEQHVTRLGLSEPTFAPDSRTIAGRGLVMPSSFQELIARWIPGMPPAAPFDALQVWSLPDWREIAVFPDARVYAYFPDGQRMAIAREDGTIELWDLPPRRPWWIDYGLPVVFALLVLLGVRLVWRAFRKPVEASPC